MPNPLAEDLDLVIQETHSLWRELRGARLFITGGTGFFGCWLLESFLWANRNLGLHASATVLTRNPGAFELKVPHLAQDPAIELYPGDVQTFETPPGSFSHIIHGAAGATVAGRAAQSLAVLDTIVQGTRRTLDFALNCGASRFLLISSGAVYGRQLPLVRSVQETYAGGPNPADPEAAYGEGKRTAELLCGIYAKSFGLEATIARCFGFVGPYMHTSPQFPAGKYLRDALCGSPIRVSDGRPVRSFLYAADLMIWLWTILLRGRPGRPYNVGSEEEISMVQLANIVAREFSPRPAVLVEDALMLGEPAERYVPSTARARHELQLRECVPLAAAIRKTALWAQAIDADADEVPLQVAL